MAGQRQPIELLVEKGRKHLTKAEIEERRATEVQPCTDDIAAPAFLTAAQKKQFVKLAEQLQKLKIMGETDVDTLARYIVAQTLYEQTVKDLRAVQRQRPPSSLAIDPEYVKVMSRWADMLEALDKRQDRYFRQAQTAAAALGLTISSRCRLVVPVKEEAPKENKFARFASGKVAGSE